MSRIQIIEADAKYGELLRSQLAGYGFQVIVSSDIETARKRLHEIVPDLLVIGLNIDDSLFFEFYRWLCRTFPWSKIPRLFLSGDKLTEIARELEIEENEEIFSRPIEIARFISTIKKLLGSRSGTLKKTDEDYLAAVPGRKIGSVIIKEEIGRGGMGAVFLGYQENLERQVAVKLLLPDMIGDPYAARRFQREAVAIARLKSPHIVQIFDFGEIDNNVFYISMEYLAGETLEQHLEKHNKLSVEKAIPIISQVARGLTTAHDAHLVHRDIKPSNLIINAENHVTITDFGLVRSQKKVGQTQSGIIAGSPFYMPPEQAAGEAMDARSDIYSLGIIFYRLVVGKVPFSGENPVKIIIQHMNDPMPDPADIVPGIPAAAAGIIKRMTEKKQADRYPGCRELLSDLESVSISSDKTMVAPVQRETGSHTVKSDKTGLADRIEKKILELSTLLPTFLSREKLLASVSLTPTGTFSNQQGKFPEEWQNNLFILQENINQVNTAVKLGQWRFWVAHTAGNLVVLFPGDTNLEVLFLQKSENVPVLKSPAPKKKGVPQKEESDFDPIRGLSSIAGVRSVFLFNRQGELSGYHQEEENSSEDYRSRLSPAALLIQSLSLEITAMDIWFEQGRVIIWKTGSGILFVSADLPVSFSLLAIFITSNLAQLDKAILNRGSSTEKIMQQIKEADGEVPVHLLDRMQLELARMIGPIGKVVFDKEIKNSGFSKDKFPVRQVPVLVEELAKKIGSGERQAFKDKIQHLISGLTGKKQ